MPVTEAAAAAADWLPLDSRSRLANDVLQQLAPVSAAMAAVSVCDPAAAAAAGDQQQAVVPLHCQSSLIRSSSDSELSRRASQLLDTAEGRSSRSHAADTAAAAATGGKGLGRRRGLLQRLLKAGFKPSWQQQQAQPQSLTVAVMSQQQQQPLEKVE